MRAGATERSRSKACNRCRWRGWPRRRMRAASWSAPSCGIGLAVHEWLPLYEDGPGDGTWNFNRYHLPRGSDVAVWTQTAEVLPPLSDSEPPKGMAEVAGIPIMAAIVNGVAHAIGHRFRTLPITPERILEVLA